MIINIFGVGRSGTKAIQVYLAYILAKKFNNVWVNYEPYFWLNRKILHRNYAGIYFDINDNFFPNKISEISNKHVEFLKHLISQNPVSVNKFIRGHGRISKINDIIKPDYTIAVIRDIQGILNSLSKTGFHLFKIGKYSQLNFFNKQISDFRKSYLFNNKHDMLIKHVKTDLQKNALIWYLYNLSLLNYNESFIVDFKNIENIESFAKHYLIENIKFDKFLFNGHNIHTDNIFIDSIINLDKEKFSSKLLLYTLNRLYPIRINNSIIGSLIKIREGMNNFKTPSIKDGQKQYKIVEDPLIQDLNTEICEKLEKRIQKQVLN